MQNGNCFLAISWRAPDALARNSHGTEAQAVDGEFSPERDCPTQGCRDGCCAHWSSLTHGNVPYARCKAKGNEKGVALLQRTYLEAAVCRLRGVATTVGGRG